MNGNFEREVISIPAGGTADLIYEYKCHAHPDKSKGYNYKNALYYTFREEGGVMKKLFTLDFTISLNPHNHLELDDYIKNPNIRERLRNYINYRKGDFGFNQWDGKYKFYIFKEVIDLPTYPKRPGQNNHCYFTLDEIYSGKEFIESSNEESEISYSENNVGSYEVDQSITYHEESVNQVLVNKYERNSKARKDCLDYYGSSCCVCGFNSNEVYKNINKNVIHVHHLKSLSKINSEYEVNPIKDLRPVCPNCHSVIHSRKPAYKIEELKMLLK